MKLIKNNLTDSDLIKTWQIDETKLALIKKVIEFDDDELIDDFLGEFKSVKHLRKQCYNPPDTLTERLEALNELIEGFGIEAIRIENYYHDRYWDNCIGLYVNMGDTYILTIIYNVIDNQFEFTSWGDFYEFKEQEIRLDSTDY